MNTISLWFFTHCFRISYHVIGKVNFVFSNTEPITVTELPRLVYLLSLYICQYFRQFFFWFEISKETYEKKMNKKWICNKKGKVKNEAFGLVGKRVFKFYQKIKLFFECAKIVKYYHSHVRNFLIYYLLLT